MQYTGSYRGSEMAERRQEQSNTRTERRPQSGNVRRRKKIDRKRQVRIRKMLLIVWSIFLVLLAFGIYFFVRNKDKLMGDMGVKKSTIYEENAVPEINKLITDYYTAYAACDQKTLKTLVVDPSQFDNMSILEKKADIVTAYNNLKVYTIPGAAADETVVYVMFNLSIVNVISQPLDITRPPLYVVKKGGGYVIDNTTLRSEVQNLIESLNQKQDILDLMKQVHDDQEKCVADDQTFKEFYDRLWK